MVLLQRMTPYNQFDHFAPQIGIKTLCLVDYGVLNGNPYPPTSLLYIVYISRP